MKKVAVVKFRDYYDSWNGLHENLVSSITDWKEVDDNQFKDLESAIDFSYEWDTENRFVIVEQVNLNDPFTLDKLISLGKRSRENFEKAERAKEEKARKAKETREANKRKKELKVLEKLKDKYEKE